MTFDDLTRWLVDYVAAYPQQYSQIAIWREPIMACAPADERFLQVRKKAHDQYLHHNPWLQVRSPNKYPVR